MLIAHAELAVEITPADRRMTFEMMQPIGKPDIDIERGGRILELLNSRIL
jgi:hypothetical protein